MKNQMLITLDSLRWDVFRDAPDTMLLKKFNYDKAYTHGTYTLPAHTAFFTGKLPCSYNGEFDTCAKSARRITGIPQWRLMNPESDVPAVVKLGGKDIVDGFNIKGYTTIGTGAVSWFDSSKPARIPAVDNFKHFGWFGEYTQAVKQIEFVGNHITSTKTPYFAFINLGETHHSFKINSNDKSTPYGNFKRCFIAQTRCLIYLDTILKRLISNLKDVDIIICGDHGDCFGEDGLWGHSFFHQKVIEVPIIKISK